MAEYIEREAVIKRLWTVSMGDDPYIMGIQRGVDHAIDVVNEAPAADVAPVVHGRWDNGKCTCCGQVDFSKPNYCPNCGAHTKDGDGNA